MEPRICNHKWALKFFLGVALLVLHFYFENEFNSNEELMWYQLFRLKEESSTGPSPKRSKESGSESDSDCITQEDLLAQLGLNSVKKLQTLEPDPNRVIEPEPPKQSILDLLKQPPSKKVLPSTAMPDKERPLTNGSFAEGQEDVENVERKEKLILRLQNNLRNEEAKLMLLRKLYACQNEKPVKETNPARTAAMSVATTTQTQSNTTAGQRKPTQVAAAQKQQQQQQQHQKGLKQMPKLLQKSKPPPPVLVQKPPQPNVPAVQPRVVFLSQPRGPQPIIIAPKLGPVADAKRAGRPVKVQMVSPATSKPTSKPHSQSLPPTAVYAHNPPVSTSKHQPTHLDTTRLTENGLPKSVSKMRSPPTPEQSHAEAKMALRKQLEKTLLEIPLPKPPIQDWNFVPSVNTQDFTILVGLEGVVNHIIESQANVEETKVFIPPKFCSQCDTDFTPGWKIKAKDASEGTLCEFCYTQKIKKSLKSEHTTRLKDAFMKALKQEQEVEKKFQLSGASVSTVGKTSAAVKPQPVRASSHHQPIRPPHIVYHPVHSIPQPQVFQPHHSIVHQLQQQQIQQQHQELDSPHRQEPARFFTYVGQPPPKQRHNYTTDNDRQREYLLDMIPSGHSSRSYRI